MFLVTARINFESYPEKLCACATVQLRNASRARQELKMAILNAAFSSRVQVRVGVAGRV